MVTRTFLFLQGVSSPFFNELAKALTGIGQSVYRINFCGGDMLYWRGLPAWNFPGPIHELAPFLQEKYDQIPFTDLVLFGDNRPIHQIAIEEACKRNLRINVFEEGYLRPNWITLEQCGVNAHSLLPYDPDWYRAMGKNLPNRGNGQTVGPSMRQRIMHDIKYHLANFVLSSKYPGYRTHRPFKAHIEYAGWIRRFSLKPMRTKAANRVVADLINRSKPYYLFPMQLDSDAQIHTHSTLRGMCEALDRIIASFAQYAPSDDQLIVKNHPLDTGLINFPGFIKRLIEKWNLHNRLIFIDGGHLPTLIRAAKGTVTVNSTVGISALFHGCPTVTLGEAIYDLPGLTFQGNLDDFWFSASPPDRELFRSFRNTIIDLSQVNGGFYSDRGIEMAVAGSLPRLLPGKGRGN